MKKEATQNARGSKIKFIDEKELTLKWKRLKNKDIR
jgi:uncharacterized protein YlaI